MLDRLFGSRTRAKLLLLFFTNKDSHFYVRELTRKVDEQINSVRRELENLTEMGILHFIEKDKKKYYSLNNQSSIFLELGQLISKTSSSVAKEAIEVLQNYSDNLELCVLTGIFVDRKDQTTTDMLLVGSIKPSDIKDIVDQFNRIYSLQLNYTHLLPSEFKLRLEVKDRFLTNILQGQKIVLLDKIHPSNVNVIAEEWSKLAKQKRTMPKKLSDTNTSSNDMVADEEDMHDLESLVDDIDIDEGIVDVTTNTEMKEIIPPQPSMF